MQKFTTCLWFDSNGEEAAKFYVSTFANSELGAVVRYGPSSARVSGRPDGSVMTVTFELNGLKLMALNGGPTYSLNPALSLFVGCDNEKEIDELFGKLSEGGSILMGLGKYPFSDRFAWVMDKYGMSWQLNLQHRSQKISPFLMFANDQHGRAEEAINFYISRFKNSRAIDIQRYGSGEEQPEGTVKVATFMLDGQEFMAIDSSFPHQFAFTPAMSFMVHCESQKEIDEMWEKLGDGGEPGPCGWLTDKFGVSWQIVPSALTQMQEAGDTRRTEQMMEELLTMSKLDLDALTRAYKA